MLVVYLSNKYIRVVNGSATGGKINVQGMHYTIDNQGAYLNGTIVNREALSEMLKELWLVNNLPKKQVYLVLNSNQISARVLEVPVMNEKNTVAYVTRELAGLERIVNPIYGYFRMKKVGKMQRIFAMSAPRDYIQQFVDIFKEMGVQLNGVESVKGSMVRLAMSMPQIQNKTCAVQFLDGSNLTNVLMVEGQFQSFNEKRLFYEPGEPQYIMEVARAVNEILQFAKAQSIEQTITHAFVAGMSSEDFPFYEEGVERIRDDIDAEELSGENVSFKCQMDQEKNFSHFCLAIGALLSSGDENNMMEQMRYTPEQIEKRKAMLRIIVPSAIAIVICLVVSAVLLSINIQRRKTLNALRAYNTNPEILEQIAQYNEMVITAADITEMEGSVEYFMEMLKEYPKVDSALVAEIQKCTLGELIFEVDGFDAENGILNFSTQAPEAEIIHKFVDRLKETDLFEKIDYSGYSQNPDLSYGLKLHCTIAPVVVIERKEETQE